MDDPSDTVQPAVAQLLQVRVHVPVDRCRSPFSARWFSAARHAGQRGKAKREKEYANNVLITHDENEHICRTPIRGLNEQLSSNWSEDG
jgi:hypothetical protein